MTAPHRHATTIASLLAVVVLAGCGTGTPEPSAGCLDDMRAAANEPDAEAANPILVDSLTSCQTADQWLEALRRHPSAMGVKDAEFVGDVDLTSACLGHENTPVCQTR